MARTTIRTEDITDAAVTGAKLEGGAVDTSGLEDDIALLGFRVASNGSLAKYNLVDQTVDAFEDASGVNSGSSTNALRDSTSNYYSGSVNDPPSGGTETTHGLYNVNTFLADGNFVVTASGNVDSLIVAGGGGAGRTGGGGGAGGMKVTTSTAVTAQTYAVVVGDGGAGSNTDSQSATSGDDSSALGITSTGGGGGGSYGAAGASGGSGGGGGSQDAGGAQQGGSASPAGQGNDGGAAHSGSDRGSGAGGGAGAAGGTGSSNTGGVGGVGLENAYRTGSNVFYAGGGGGSGNSSESAGGNGGGGQGQRPATGAGTNGTANTGGGGGGGANALGGAGGSGIVVIRSLTSQWVSYDNMTLVSNTTAAQAAPTKGDIVLTYTNGAGTTTLGTDLTAEISADGGSTWTALALGSEGSTGSHNIATAHDVTISSTITAPYNMAYRIKTLNQSVSKTTRIQAVSLGWS